MGEYLECVAKDSAILGLPPYLEKQIPVDSDHSNMVKFDHRSDRTYQDILLCLHRLKSDLRNRHGSFAFPSRCFIHSNSFRTAHTGRKFECS